MHNSCWPQIPGHLYRILVASFASEKTNAPLNVIKHQPDIGKIFQYAKDPFIKMSVSHKKV